MPTLRWSSALIAPAEEPPPTLASITVTKLLGRYNYTITANRDDETVSRLILLYGDNGSGKTTLLRLVWHLLSPDDDRGHRTHVAQTAFSRLSLQLSNGHRILVSRAEGDLLGAFSVRVTEGRHKVIASYDYDVDERLVVKKNDRDIAAAYHERLQAIQNANYDELLDAGEWLSYPGDPYIAYLEATQISPYILGDDRVIKSDRIAKKSRRRPSEWRPAHGVDEPDASENLDEAVTRAGSIIRSLALNATNSGTENANSVYLDVVGRLTEAGGTVPDELWHALMSQIHSLGRRTANYSRFSMIPTLDAKAYLSQLARPSIDRRVTYEILQPYLDGLEKRLDALASVYSLVDTLLTRANEMLLHKELHFDVRVGFRVVVPMEDSELPLGSLSSGERQLLLLLCNTIAAREETGIFIIDEPEISLNVKWQRKLLKVLLELTEGYPLQFIVATHSIEMIAPNRDSLVRLTSEDA